MTIEKRLERIEAILDARGLDWDHPRVASDHFADANKMVAEEPAKEAVDHLAAPRISPGEWLDIRDAYRDVTPADVGRLVYVRNGELEPWIELRLAEVTGADFPYRCTKDGLDPTMWQAFRYAVIRNERPAKEPEPEYREPVLPADLGKWAEFSHDGINWMRYKLRGCHKESEASLTIWSEKNIGFRHCRIKKDA